MQHALPKKSDTRESSTESPRSDFQSLLISMHTPMQAAPQTQATQPAKHEENFKPAEAAPQTPSKEIKYDANEKLATPTNINPMAQKAGHETAESKLDNKQEVKNSTTASQRLDQIRSDLLGLSKNKPTETRNAQKPIAELKAKSPAERLMHAQTTLKEVALQPNAVIERNHGLKRLMEELGLLNPRLNAKKLETANKAGHRSEIETTDSKNTAKLGTQPAISKAGDGSKNQDPSAFNQFKDENKYAKSTNKIVSRETKSVDLPVIATPLQTNQKTEDFAQRVDLTVKTMQPNQPAASEVARANIDAPALSTVLRQQLDEIISRAQIQITDTQNANFSVRLNPKDLGRVDLDLRLRDGELTGKIVVESEAVRQEMQNFLNDSNSNPDFKGDFRNIDVEVRPDQQNARENQREKNPEHIIPDLIARNEPAYETNSGLSQRSTPVGIYA